MGYFFLIAMNEMNDSKNEMLNRSYILNINYNINKEKFAKVQSTSYLRKLREGFICFFEKWDSSL